MGKLASAAGFGWTLLDAGKPQMTLEQSAVVTGVQQLWELLTDSDSCTDSIHRKQLQQLHGGDLDGIFRRLHGGHSAHYTHGDSDELLSIGDLQAFFQNLACSRGSLSAVLLLRYLHANGSAAASQLPTTIRPVRQLLLSGFDTHKPPAAVPSPHGMLTELQLSRIGALFRLVDSDGDSVITAQQLAAKWGLNSLTLLLTAADHSSVRALTMVAWSAYFSQALRERGHRTIQFILSHLEHRTNAQKAFQLSLSKATILEQSQADQTNVTNRTRMKRGRHVVSRDKAHAPLSAKGFLDFSSQGVRSESGDGNNAKRSKRAETIIRTQEMWESDRCRSALFAHAAEEVDQEDPNVFNLRQVCRSLPPSSPLLLPTDNPSSGCN